MLDLIESIFGEYSPVVVEELDATGSLVRSYTPDGLAGVNWPYVLGVLGFFLVLYCFLRMIGGVFSRNR